MTTIAKNNLTFEKFFLISLALGFLQGALTYPLMSKMPEAQHLESLGISYSVFVYFVQGFTFLSLLVLVLTASRKNWAVSKWLLLILTLMGTPMAMQMASTLVSLPTTATLNLGLSSSGLEMATPLTGLLFIAQIALQFYALYVLFLGGKKEAEQ